MRLICFCFLLVLPAICNADVIGAGSGNVIQEEDILRVPTTEISDFPGESFSIHSQNPRYDHLDLHIPGNNGMDINVRRSYGRESIARSNVNVFGTGWSLDLPHIGALPGTGNNIGLNGSFGCLGNLHGLSFFYDNEMLRTKGFANSSDLPSGAILVFDNNSVFFCEEDTPKLKTADGKIITYGKKVSLSYAENYFITSIEDRFGNEITYNYYSDFEGEPRIKSINRNDGAIANFRYKVVSGRQLLDYVYYGNRRTTYNYQVYSSNGPQLANVTDNEGLTTIFKYSSFGRLTEVEISTGAKIAYKRTTLSPDNGRFHQVYSKTITGPNIQPRTISYQARPGDYKNQRHVLVTVNEFDFIGNQSKKTFYAFRNIVGINETSERNGTSALNGTVSLIVVKLGGVPQAENDGEEYLRVENTWDKYYAGSIGCRKGVGYKASNPNAYAFCGRARLSKSTLTLKTDDGQDSFTTEYLSYDKYDNLLKTKEYMSGKSRVKYTKTGHINNINPWVISLPNTYSVSSDDISYSEISRTNYYSFSGSLKGLPSGEYHFGRRALAYSTYHNNGERRKVLVSGSSSYQEFSDYLRGVPRKVVKPHPYESSSEVFSTSSVNVHGNITRSVDFEGNRTDYVYDDIGRLTQENFYGVQWLTKFQSYLPVSDADINIPGANIKAGQQKHTYTHGNHLITKYLDGLGRVFLVWERDASDSSTSIYTGYKYSKNGRPSFISYPSSSVNYTSGISIEYDAIGREVSRVESVTGNIMSTKYFRGNKQKVKDYRGNKTTTEYRAFGYPTTKFREKVSSPESVVTTVKYNKFDNVTSISQGGYTKRFVYDEYQRLCKRYTPEIGWTYFDYDLANNLKWRAEGVTSTVNSVCDRSVVAESLKVKFQHDILNRLYKEIYPDATPSNTYVRDFNNQLIEAKNSNTQWNYYFNDLSKLSRGELLVDGKYFSFSYTYDENQYHSSTTFSSGKKVQFVANALGQVTAVPGIIDSVSYYSNGALDEISYANGVVQKMTLNSRQLPETIEATKPGGGYVAKLTYGYDKNANIDSILDGKLPAYNLDLGYDGLDRLTTANGYWGSGEVIYDNLGNITRKTLGNRTLTYHYDQATNLLESISGAKTYIFDYDDRGNVVENAHRPFNYNFVNQLVSSNAIKMTYDANKNRVKKSNNTGSEYYIYNMAGKLSNKLTSDNELVDYIYLKNNLIAKSTSGVSSWSPEPIKSAALHWDGNSLNLSLTGAEQSNILRSLNLDDANKFLISWENISAADVRVEYKIDFVGSSSTPKDIPWTYYTTLFGPTSGDYFPLDKSSSQPEFPDISVGSDRHNAISGDYNNAIIYYRIRAEKSGTTGPWQYMRPLWIYFQS